MDKNIQNSFEGYEAFLKSLKTRIRETQVRAAISVNSELILLYWQIGKEISKEITERGWGADVVNKLSQDLRKQFPEMKGFSPRNLRYMRTFAETYMDPQFLQQVVAKIPWGHNVRILDYAKDEEERCWYLKQTLHQGWSRDVLKMHIKTKLYHRQGKSISNFDKTMPELQSDLAQQVLKDPYAFDFLSLGDEAHERNIELTLVDNIQKFLLELGVGFTFVGRQYHLDVGEQDFYIDLLFYHLRLRCFVVIELKAAEFKPEYAGKMNFYLSAVDRHLKHSQDQPSIGLILCEKHNKVVAEYALQDINKPIGISEYRLNDALPEKLKGQLPTIEQLEAELKPLSADENGD